LNKFAPEAMRNLKNMKQVSFFASLILLATLIGCSGTGNSICCVSNTGGADIQTPTVKVLTLNLAHGRRDSINQIFVSEEQTYKNLNLIAGLLRKTKADVAALQEADDPSPWSGGFDHVEYLSDQTGWPNYVHGLHADGWLYTFGTAVLSRHRIADSSLNTFEPSFPTTTKGFVSATFNWMQGDMIFPLTVISVHFDFSRQSVREEQTAQLVAFAKELNGPYVIAGDFNSEWKDTDSTLQELKSNLNLQVFDPEGTDMGTYKSLEGKRLDWILLSPELQFVNYAIRTEVLSDHLAVVAEISLR
jgi:endonuclease/exonuclease/phosphatase family metal-dependent hydrolase